MALTPYISKEQPQDLLVLLNEQKQGNPDELRLLAQETQAPVIAQIQKTGATVEDSFWLVNGLRIKATDAQLKEIQKIPSISQITPNRVFYPLRNQSIPLIGATAAHASGWNGTGVTIAILDTGVNFSKPELGASRVVNETDIVTSDSEGYNTTDFWGHGTDMALIAAGSGGNNYGIGVAPNASLDNVKVFSFNSSAWTATEGDVISGLQWLTALANKPDIVLMSFGTPDDGTCSGPLITAIDSVVSSGIAVVSAVGDMGPCSSATRVEYAGCSKKVIAVGATIDGGNGGHNLSTSSCESRNYTESQTDVLIGTSSRGPTVNSRIKPDLTAPGFYIETGSGYSNDLTTYTSSAAAAHVAGTVALMQQKMRATESKNLTTAQVKAILMNSANELGAPGRDNLYGAGRVNVTEALLESNSSYVKSCTLWNTVPITYKLYHQITVPVGVTNISVTAYWEENNATDHANIGLKLIEPDLVITNASDPSTDIARQIRKGTSKNGTWYAILDTDHTPSGGYSIVSNYPLGNCQISDVDTVRLTLYNSSDFSVQNQTTTFWPSYRFDQYNNIIGPASYVYYKIEQKDAFGLPTNRQIRVVLKRDMDNGTTMIDGASPNSGDGLFLSNNTPGASVFLDSKAAATCSEYELNTSTCRSFSPHSWALEVYVSKSLGSVWNYSNFTMNKTYGVGMNMTSLNQSVRYGQSGNVNLSIENLGNVGDLYAIGYQMSRVQGSSTSKDFAGACTANPSSSVLVDWNQTNASTFQIGIPSDATGGDGCYIYLNTTSEKAYAQANESVIDDGTVTDINTILNPTCDGLHTKDTANYSYFTYTPAKNVNANRTCFAWATYSSDLGANSKYAFNLYYAKDNDGNYVPNPGTSYSLAFSHAEASSPAPPSGTGLYGPPWTISASPYLVCFDHANVLLEGGQKYSFKLESTDPDRFELLTIEKAGLSGSGACTQNVSTSSDPAPSGCTCDTSNLGTAHAGTALIRFYGSTIQYGYNESTATVYATDNITLNILKPLSASEHARNEVMPVEVNATNHLGDFILGASANALAFDGLGRAVSPPALAQSGALYTNSSAYSIPRTTLSGNTSAVGSWTLIVNASRDYFSNASRNVSFTVRGASNISIDTAGSRFYRGQNTSLSSTVRNEFGDIENPSAYNVSWKLNSTGIAQAEDASYVFSEEIGPYTLNASANGTYLNYSQASRAVELWDVLNASITTPVTPSLGDSVEIRANTTRSFNESVSSGITVTCSLPKANNNTGANVSASYSSGLWRCPYTINKDSDPRGNWSVNITLSGQYYNITNQSSSFWVRGSDFNITPIASNYSIGAGDSITLNSTFTNIGDSATSGFTVSLELPSGISIASGTTPQWPSELNLGGSYSTSWSLASSPVPGNYTINVTAGASNGPRKTSQVVLQVNETLGMRLLTSTPISALAGRNTTLALNLTYNTYPLDDIENFTAQNITVRIGNSSAVIQNLSLTGDGLWNLTFANPAIGDASAYDLVVNSSYRNAKRSLTVSGGLYYLPVPHLNITLIAPAQVNASRVFNITANVTNTGNANATPANITLSLPPQLSLSGTPALQQYDLGINSSRLVVWNVTTEIGGNYVVSANISAENATERSANATIEAISVLSVRILSPNSSAKANVTINDSFNSMLNVSFNGTTLTGSNLSLSNFSAEIDPASINITSATYASGLWNLTLKIGSISEAVDYTLKVTARYGNYTTIGDSPSAVHGKETPPVISFAASPSRILVNTSATLTATVTDNSGVANVTGNITYPSSGSVFFNFTKNGNDYTYLLLPSEVGFYNLSIVATDIFGVQAYLNVSLASNGAPSINSVQLIPSRYLFQNEAVTFLINASSGLGIKNVTVNVTNTIGGTSTNTTNSSASGYSTSYSSGLLGTYPYAIGVEDNYNNTNARNGTFEVRGTASANISVPAGANANLLLEGERVFNATGTVLKGNYTLNVSGGNLTLAFHNISISANTTGNVNFTAFNSTNTTMFSLHRGYQITSNVSYQSVNISIGFNASAVNISRLAIYRCANLTGASCTGGWNELSSSTDNVTNRTSAVSGTLSAYALGERHTFSLGINSASPTSDLRSGNTIAVNASLLYDGSAISNASFSADVDGTNAAVSAGASGSSWLMNVTAPSLSGGSRTLRVYATYGDWRINSSVSVSYYTAPAQSGDSGSTDSGGSIIAPPATVKSAKIIDYPSSISLAPGESFSRDVTVNNTGNAKFNVTLYTTLAWATVDPAKGILAGKTGKFTLAFSVPGSVAEGSYDYKIQAFDGLRLLDSKDAVLVVKSVVVEPPAEYIKPEDILVGTINAQKTEATRLSSVLEELRQKGFDVNASLLQMDNVSIQLDQAGLLVGSGALGDASTRVDGAKAAMGDIESSVTATLDAEYISVKGTAGSQNNARALELLSNARASIDAGDYSKAADYIMQARQQLAVQPPPEEPSNLPVALALILVLASLGSAAYYKKDAIVAMVPKQKKVIEGMKIKAIYVHEKYNALLGRDVILSGTVSETVERKTGWWLVVKDDSGETLVWSPKALNIGDTVTVSGKVHIDDISKSIYIEGREIIQEFSSKGIEESRVETEKPALYWLGLELSNVMKEGSVKDKLGILLLKLRHALEGFVNAILSLPKALNEKIREIRTRPGKE